MLPMVARARHDWWFGQVVYRATSQIAHMHMAVYKVGQIPLRLASSMQSQQPQVSTGRYCCRRKVDREQ